MPGNSTSHPLALITGVGPGTGAVLAHRFSAGGFDVAMLARYADRLPTLEQEITNAKAYACDVTDEAQFEAVIAAVEVELGAPSVLIHNAVGMIEVEACCSDSAKHR